MRGNAADDPFFESCMSQVGFIHGDPHPGNLLKVTEGPHAGKLALLDFGLVAEIPLADRCSLRCALCTAFYFSSNMHYQSQPSTLTFTQGNGLQAHCAPNSLCTVQHPAVNCAGRP